MSQFSRHENIVLQFSGGRDSLACLYLLQDYWDRLTVLWVNSGAAFPETIAQMESIRALVPHFLEVKSDQPSSVIRFGPPSDVVPMWASPFGRQFSGRDESVQSPLGCCDENIWTPGQRATVGLGATLIIRGQRNAESKKSPVRSGDVIDGIEYWFPVQDWSKKEVDDFLESKGVELPEYYAVVGKSLDCTTCTAYLDEGKGKFAYMKTKHPELYADVRQQLGGILRAMRPDLESLLDIYNGENNGF